MQSEKALPPNITKGITRLATFRIRTVIEFGSTRTSKSAFEKFSEYYGRGEGFASCSLISHYATSNILTTSRIERFLPTKA